MALTSRHFVSLMGTECSMLSRYYLYRKSLHFFVQVISTIANGGCPSGGGGGINAGVPERQGKESDDFHRAEKG